MLGEPTLIAIQSVASLLSAAVCASIGYSVMKRSQSYLNVVFTLALIFLGLTQLFLFLDNTAIALGLDLPFLLLSYSSISLTIVMFFASALVLNYGEEALNKGVKAMLGTKLILDFIIIWLLGGVYRDPFNAFNAMASPLYVTFSTVSGAVIYAGALFLFLMTYYSSDPDIRPFFRWFVLGGVVVGLAMLVGLLSDSNRQADLLGVLLITAAVLLFHQGLKSRGRSETKGPRTKDPHTPHYFLIINEGGAMIYGRNFRKATNTKIKPTLLSGFISSMMIVMDEAFGHAEVEMIKYERYQILFKEVNGLIFAYVYEGGKGVAGEMFPDIVETILETPEIHHYLYQEEAVTYNHEIIAVLNEVLDVPTAIAAGTD